MLASHPALRRWLQADGSLTARLRRHGQVTVQVLAQSAMPLWREERLELAVRCGYVREVILLLDGVPVVWARSATTYRAIQGPWRALRGLGSRPLAELLFTGRQVLRAPLQAWRAPRSSLQDRHIRRKWQLETQQTAAVATPRWARSSVFLHKGHPLRVMEVFSPWVIALATV